MTRKAKSQEKPREQMTEQERMEDWRRKRLAKGAITRPGGKVMGKQKSQPKEKD